LSPGKGLQKSVFQDQREVNLTVSFNPIFEEKVIMRVKIVFLLTIMLLTPVVMSYAYPLVPIDSIQAVVCGGDSSLMAGD